MAHPAAAAAAPQVPAFIVHNFNTIRHLGAGGYGVTWQACANAEGAAPDIDGDEDLQGVPRGPELVVKMVSMQSIGQSVGERHGASVGALDRPVAMRTSGRPSSSDTVPRAAASARLWPRSSLPWPTPSSHGTTSRPCERAASSLSTNALASAPLA
ncbi:unnamed protein product [Vitrella brassicaformis CCMP3155]|uniref:Protein kinase domain-containing protein n=1 Tax=Vitrella brassicaformis (strain CCMP3155) TaxID=1169540 RepID=A0A0G4EJ05_VITBC|nr:unnamed protein product [Vitrella brassicaformis CCMP3155]|eukprot:CEL95889.1 unnamed protein product [Vitrella brassicaformis CCMP3155]